MQMFYHYVFQLSIVDRLLKKKITVPTEEESWRTTALSHVRRPHLTSSCKVSVFCGSEHLFTLADVQQYRKKLNNWVNVPGGGTRSICPALISLRWIPLLSDMASRLAYLF